MDHPHNHLPRRNINYSADAQSQILGAHKVGASDKVISIVLKIPEPSIHRIISQWKDPGPVEDAHAPRPDQPKNSKTTTSERKYHVLDARKQRDRFALELEKRLPRSASPTSMSWILAEKAVRKRMGCHHVSKSRRK